MADSSRQRMATADDRLSRAASAVYAIRDRAHEDFDMDASGDCGSLIAEAHQQAALAAIAEHGFDAESYNAELRARLAPSYPSMSHATHLWLQLLEVESEQEWHESNTYVDTGGELSSLAYLRGDDSLAGAR